MGDEFGCRLVAGSGELGRKRLLLVSLDILAVGSLLAALSGSLGVLIAPRAVQGLGTGTFPLAFGLVRELFARERVPVVIGTISAVFGIGYTTALVVACLISAAGFAALAAGRDHAWAIATAFTVSAAALVLAALLGAPRKARL